MPPLWGLYPWLFEPLRSIELLHSIAEEMEHGTSGLHDISPFQGSTFFRYVTQGCGDTASKERSPAASTLGWYISPLWGLYPVAV